MFKKKVIVIMMLLALVLSCDKINNNTCYSDNPIEDLAWLKEFKNNLTGCVCERSILQGTYNKRTVFFTMMTDPVCDAIFNVVLLDCNGATVKAYNYDELNTYSQEVTDIKVLYRCKD